MSEGDGKAGGGGAAAKPALSSRLLGLKFMQRSREKEQRAAAEEAAEERDAEVRRRLVRGWALKRLRQPRARPAVPALPGAG